MNTRQQYLVTIYSKENGKDQLEQMLKDETRAETLEAYAVKDLDIIKYKIEEALLEFYNLACTQPNITYSDIQGMAMTKSNFLFTN